MLTLREKIAYGLGDTACNFIWQASMLLLAYYYTDVFGIPAGIMGTLFLVSRILDAVIDPIMGAIVDRTRTKYGQFRPYLLWFSIPFGVISILTFYTPDFSPEGKIIYACVTYTLLTLVYTIINVPYCSMPGALTTDPKERHSLQSIRFFLVAVAALIVSGTVLPLVDIIGQGDEQRGYFGAMTILSIIGVALFFICFANTKEHYTFSHNNSSIKDDLKLLVKNSQWRTVCIFKICTSGSNTIRIGATLYFMKYVLENPEFTTTFILFGSIAAMFGSLSSAKLLANFDRIFAYKILIIVYAIINIIIFFAISSNIWLIFVLNLLFMFVLNVTTPLQWLMASDVTDYEEHKSGVRLDGMVFSTYLFSIKVGLAIGGAIVGWTLAFTNYDPTLVSQPDDVVFTIKFLFCILPVIFYFIQFLMLTFFYRLDNKTVSSIANALEQKRRAKVTA